MAYLDRPDARIYFEDTGTGIPILLSHGFAATASMWDRQLAALADRYRVIRWDMRGHGRTKTENDVRAYRPNLVLDDMQAILDRCQVDRAVIAGLSLGGYMSIAFCAAYPDRTALLGLFGTGPGFKDAAARAQWNERAEAYATQFETEGLPAAVRYANRTYMNRTQEPASAPIELGFHYHDGTIGLAAAARGLLTQRDASTIESLPLITVGTLIVVGSEDKPFLPASNYMAKKIPHAERVVIEGAGHAPNMTHPNPFNESLRSFLDRCCQHTRP